MKFVDFMADSRDFYTGLIDPVCKKYGLTQMEFNILLFLANNPEFDTAAQITKVLAFVIAFTPISLRLLGVFPENGDPILLPLLLAL